MLGGLSHLDFRSRKDFRKQFARLLAKLRGERPPRGRASVRRSAARTTGAAMLVPALPDDRKDPDAEPESLLSNLLPVTKFPQLVWSAPTPLRKKAELPTGTHLPPFILRENRLFTFTDLSMPASAFAPWVAAQGSTRHAAVEWQDDSVRWRWFIELLNLTLRAHLRPEVHFDRAHQRFWFVPQGNGSVRLQWGGGTRRTIVRAPSREGANWIHHAAYLRFETIGTRVFLSINPTYVFTTDGWRAVSEAELPALASQWGGRERNGTILRSILLWADAVTKGKKSLSIEAGDQSLEISRLPVAVEAPVSVADDHVNVKALLWFSNEELSLTTPFAFVTAEDVAPEELDDDEE